MCRCVQTKWTGHLSLPPIQIGVIPAALICFTASNKSSHIFICDTSIPAWFIRSLLYHHATWETCKGKPTLCPSKVNASAAAALTVSK